VTIQAEARVDDFAFPVVEDIQQIANLVAEILVAELLKGILRLVIADDIAKRGVVIVAERLIQRGGTDRRTFQRSYLGSRHTDFLGQFLVGGLATQLLGHLIGNPAQLGDFIDQVDGQADRFALIGQRSLDGLLDPPRRVGAQLAAFFGVKPLDRFHEADIALGNEVQERETEIAIVARDFDDQAEVRANHDGARLHVAALDATGLQLYLRQIGEYPLITVQDEIKLARRIKRGDMEARAIMVRSNLRLVVKIARDYSNFGLPLLDLISEGNIGLMKAVERFDPKKGGKLSTYAAWWIKQSIKRALANQSKTIRLPVHLVDKIAKLRRVSNQMTEELGREPTDEELAEEVGMAAAKVASLKSAAIRPTSLDQPLGDDDHSSLGDIIGDDEAQDPFEQLRDKDLRNEVGDLLDVLDDRERKIINSRFGLDGHKTKTLEEVGVKFGVTRERIRQLQNIALRKLRRALQKKDRSKVEFSV